MHDYAMDALLPYPDPQLDDGVVRLRPWRRADLDCVRLAATDPRIPKDTSVPTVFSPSEGQAFIERQWSRTTNGEGVSLAIADAPSDAAVGLVVALFRERIGVVGVGYWVIPTSRGRGFAGRALGLLTPWLLGRPSTTRVEAMVEPENAASRRTLERSGFRQERLLRLYLDGARDVLVYSLGSADPPTE
jgi:RimJ/RimL family protein N-acetyltransferase